jgi:hypothetical protein
MYRTISTVAVSAFGAGTRLKPWLWDFTSFVNPYLPFPPTAAFLSSRLTSGPQVALAVNAALPKHWFDSIWQSSTLRVCADGGANRVHEFYSNVNTSGVAHRYRANRSISVH